MSVDKFVLSIIERQTMTAGGTRAGQTKSVDSLIYMQYNFKYPNVAIDLNLEALIRLDW